MTQPETQKMPLTKKRGAVRFCGGTGPARTLQRSKSEVAQAKGFREPVQNSHITVLAGTGLKMTQPVTQPDRYPFGVWSLLLPASLVILGFLACAAGKAILWAVGQ